MALSDYIGSSEDEDVEEEFDNGTEEDNAYADIQRIQSFTSSCQVQEESPLFNVLPAELRELVYTYVFTEFEDLSRSYDIESCYRRPGYMAPRKTHTSLLRTCQAIYKEAWYLPWTLAQHTFYLAWDGRKPNKTTTTERMRQICDMMERLHTDIPDRFKTIPHVQVFSQLCNIRDIYGILNIPHFMPRTITITLRHTDIWSWESDHPLSVDSYWVPRCRIPSSVSLVRMQVESLERKKEQVDHIADRMRKEWFWERADDIHLVGADTYAERWTGCSTWQEARWLRDEDDNDPERLHYYVATVSFRPVTPADDSDGYKHRKQLSFHDRLRAPQEIVNRTRLIVPRSFLTVPKLQQAGILPGTPASEVWKAYDQWVGGA